MKLVTRWQPFGFIDICFFQTIYSRKTDISCLISPRILLILLRADTVCTLANYTPTWSSATHGFTESNARPPEPVISYCFAARESLYRTHRHRTDSPEACRVWRCFWLDATVSLTDSLKSWKQGRTSWLFLTRVAFATLSLSSTNQS